MNGFIFGGRYCRFAAAMMVIVAFIQTADLRKRFGDLGFPVENKTYKKLMARVTK